MVVLFLSLKFVFFTFFIYLCKNYVKMANKIIVNGEPKEVTDIRNKILNEFKDLTFIEEGHKYFLNGEQLPSVSEVTHRFSQYPFDSEERAAAYAEKNGETPQYWLDKWRFTSLKATTSGTLTHEYGEGLGWLRNGHPEFLPDSCKPKYIKDKGWLIPTRPKEEAVLKFYDELHPNLHFVLAETKVYTGKNPKLTNLKQNYCGTFDILMHYDHPTDKDKSGLVIMDYKGLPLDTPIATTNGWKTIGTVEEGDMVFDKNGRPTKILHISEIHHNPCYKIKFDNNDEIIADCDHRWEISFEKKRMLNRVIHTVYENKVMTTREIAEYLPTVTKRMSRNIPKIMVSKPIECEKKELPIDPYVFGCWLGDGNTADGKITNMYKELWDEIKRRGYEIGKDVSQGGAGKAQTRTVFGLTHELRLLNCLHNKHIPDIFMFSSYEQRLDILRGLMDTDGHYNKKRKRFVMSTTQEWQAACLYKLLSTLGVKATKIRVNGRCNNCKKYQNGVFERIDVAFYCDFNPFLIRNIEIERPKNNNNRIYRNILAVEKTETVETKCLEVESETHTFCCGYNMLVTHNTNRELRKDFSRENGKFLLPPFGDLYEEPLSFYTLQLSCYQIPLEDIGLKVIARRIVWLKDDGSYELLPLQDVTDRLREVL